MNWEYEPVPHYHLVVGGFIEAEIYFDEDRTTFGEPSEWRLVIKGNMHGRFSTLEAAQEKGMSMFRKSRGMHLVQQGAGHRAAAGKEEVVGASPQAQEPTP